MRKKEANIHELRTLLGKLYFVHAPVLPPAMFFINHMLDTLRTCLTVGAATLSAEFWKDLNWFTTYLP